MNKKKWIELIPGAVNPDAGSSIKNLAMHTREEEKPVFNAEFCTQCLICWLYCPQNAIFTENKTVQGINYDHCDGCGICVNECPVDKAPFPLSVAEKKVGSSG